MCYCPESIPPPNEKIKMSLAMVIVIVASAVAGAFSNMITCSILILLLYCSWTQFNWCMLVFFCIYCAYSIVQTFVLLAGLIQYKFMFTNQYMAVSVMVVLELVYFPVALFFSHFVYRNFKNITLEGGVNPPNPLGGMGGMGGMGAGNYQNLQEPQPVMGQPVVNSARQQQQQRENFSAFQGRGVRIG